MSDKDWWYKPVHLYLTAKGVEGAAILDQPIQHDEVGNAFIVVPKHQIKNYLMWVEYEGFFKVYHLEGHEAQNLPDWETLEEAIREATNAGDPQFVEEYASQTIVMYTRDRNKPFVTVVWRNQKTMQDQPENNGWVLVTN